MPEPDSTRTRIGVDIGGTFTDLVLVDEETGTVRVGKLLTTPKEPAHAVEKTRPAYFPETGGYVETAVYDRYTLEPGARFAGPAIIEECRSTTVVGPGTEITVEARLMLRIEPSE